MRKSDSSSRDDKKRLRHRFREGGIEGFDDVEILELLLSFVRRGADVREPARALIERFGGLKGALEADPADLRTVPGVGGNAALMLSSVRRIASAYRKEKTGEKEVIRSPKDVLDYLNFSLPAEGGERFLAIYLNPRNEVIATEVLHEGAVDPTVVYPRKAIEKAFKHGARSVVFVHYLPGGDPAAPQLDRQLVRVLDRAALAVDLIVHDHLIIKAGGHFSARENGWAPGHPLSFPKAAEP